MSNNQELTTNELETIDNNQLIKNKKVNYWFVLNNYGKCQSFLNEILQTEGITVFEHHVLKEILRVKFNFNYLIIIY
jgi:hypothetical protein